jgi:hypothetical protein
MIRKNKTVISLIGIICLFMITCMGCTPSDIDWPSTDEMIRNLQSKGYNIIEETKVTIGDEEYIGRVIIATKGSDFVAGFWTDDVNAAVQVYNYWSAIYKSEHTLRVGTTVYSGTDRAIRHAGVNLK